MIGLICLIFRKDLWIIDGIQNFYNGMTVHSLETKPLVESSRIVLGNWLRVKLHPWKTWLWRLCHWKLTNLCWIMIRKPWLSIELLMVLRPIWLLVGQSKTWEKTPKLDTCKQLRFRRCLAFYFPALTDVVTCVVLLSVFSLILFQPFFCVCVW